MFYEIRDMKVSLAYLYRHVLAHAAPLIHFPLRNINQITQHVIIICFLVIILDCWCTLYVGHYKPVQNLLAQPCILHP